MKIKLTLLAVFLLTAIITQAQTVKIGYTNIELISSYMPEYKSMESEILLYQKKLQEQLQVKQSYGQQKLTEYYQMKEKNTLTPDQAKAKEDELLKLEQEIAKFTEDSEYNLMLKKESLLGPILEKLQKVIEEVAKEKGYTYILNQTTSAGVSTILFGPEQDDITEDLMKKLGITIPAGTTTGDTTTTPGPVNK